MKKYESRYLLFSQESDLDVDQIDDATTSMSDEISSFIQVLVRAVILFYNFDVCRFKVFYEDPKSSDYIPCDTLNFENLMNFVTILMFPRRTYKLMLNFLTLQIRNKNSKLNSNRAKYQREITLGSLGVNDKFFEQDETGDDFVMPLPQKITQAPQRFNSMGRGMNIDSDRSLEDRDERNGLDSFDKADPSLFFSQEPAIESINTREQRLVNHGNTFQIKKEELKQIIETQLEYDGCFSEAIKTLEYISIVESPFEKMKVLLTTVRKVISEINQRQEEFEGKQEILTGDQIMGLVIYVVANSKSPDLMTHLEFIDLFLPKKFFNTFCGYYLTVFNAACEYMIDYKPKDQREDEELEDDFGFLN